MVVNVKEKENTFELTQKKEKGKLKEMKQNRELQQITKKEYDELNWEANTFHCQKHNTFWYAGDRQPVYCKDCGEWKKLYKLRSVARTNLINEKVEKLFDKYIKRIEERNKKIEGEK